MIHRGLKYRQGRKNKHTIYLQMGVEPSDTDPFVGSAVGKGLATQLVNYANKGIEAEKKEQG